MSKVKTNSPITEHTIDVLLEEMIDECYEPWVKQLERYRRSRSGSETQRDALCKLWTLCHIAEIKGKVLGDAIDEYLGNFPDDD